ncbi:MAG: PhoH family protein, partial [Flavobacteriales bacterium]|nr:PhoH family protein [Flavobacteriales bacterium]
TYFPKLKVVSRGDTLKAIGDDEEIKLFESKIALLIAHLLKYKQLTENNIERLMDETTNGESQTLKHDDDILVFGNAGLIVKPKTANQRKLVKESEKNDLVFAVGPAGTGKSYTAVALAVRALKNKEVRRIILTRPAVEAGEHLGFLPGDLKEKLDPYLQPLYDALRDMIPAEKLKEMLEDGTIQIAPLAFMRGRTLDRAFVILDEAQNATKSQFKMFLTRMGKSAKFIINGDETQVDLPRNQQSGLTQAISLLNNVKGISIVRFDEKDVIRHDLVKKIIIAYKDQKE